MNSVEQSSIQSRNYKRLQSSKLQPRDELYTTYLTAKKLVDSVRKHLDNKRVYCPCDMHTSNIIKYLIVVQKQYNIKSIVATSIQGITTRVDERGNVTITHGEPVDITTPNGKYFRKLNNCDIVITNPPFSLLSYFIPTLINAGVKYAIISSLVGLFTNTIRPFMIAKQFYSTGTLRDKYIVASSNQLKHFVSCFVYGSSVAPIELKNSFVPTARFGDNRYNKYYNLAYSGDVIDVPTLKLIPVDYDGVIAVPMTYLQHHNPYIFDIVEEQTHLKKHINQQKLPPKYTIYDTPNINVRRTNHAYIHCDRNDKRAKYHDGEGNYYYTPFSRCLIQQKKII